MDIDWMKEFDKISIPHADSFVEEYRERKRIKDANRKFNQTYHYCIRQSTIKIKFSEDIRLI